MSSQVTATHVSKPNMMQRVLRANAAFSGITGAALLVSANPIASFLGVSVPVVLMAIGGTLLMYAAVLFWVAGQPEQVRQATLIAAILDTLWVAGSIVLLITDLVPLTVGGKWAVAIVADIVGLLAILEFYSLIKRGERLPSRQ